MNQLDNLQHLCNFMAAMPKIRLPQNLTATVVRWQVSPGQAIAVGQVLVELAAEDTLVHIESPVAGTMAAIIAQPGTSVAGGDALSELGAADHVTPPVSPQPPTAMPDADVPAAPDASAANVIPILMPEAGNSMEEGTILAWKVKPGDRVVAGQMLCEIETDKATMEYESPAAGRIARIVVGDGESIAVKQPIAYLADDDAAVDVWLKGQGTGDGPREPTLATSSLDVTARVVDDHLSPSTVTVTGRRLASPAARKLASERHIDLATVGSGSGPRGRILSTDLAHARPAAAASGEAIRRPMSKMRRAIAANLQKSKQTVPHFYVRLTIDADPLLAFYKAQKLVAGCTINDVVVAAVARTMMAFPAVRSRADGNDLLEMPDANIGVAVGVPDGLVVPVVLAAQRLTLPQLAAETRRVVEAARKGKVENMGRGNFTISNLGMFGVEEFAAIINPPESAILAVAAARETVVVKDGAMRPGRVMTLTLSVDHRVVDGLLAAQFLAGLKEQLEHPDTLAA